MAQLLPNNFSSYLLSPAEEEAGQVFNLNQKMVLQNKLAAIAQEKLKLIYTPSDQATFLQREAELQGQMGIIEWLLDTSQQVEDLLASRVATQE